MQNFSELPISSYLKEKLASANFVLPTPVQAAAIPQALAGKDVLATAQTGTGKTLAFLIPTMEKLLAQPSPGIAALVLVPTRELALQVAEQYNALRGKKLPQAAVVVGGLSEGNQISAIRHGARMIVATPGRLEDFLDRRLVAFPHLHTLVLDEADRMLDMGFQPAIRRIVSVLPQQRHTMCFSATLEGSVAHLVKDYTRNAVRLELGSVSKPAENVTLRSYEVSHTEKSSMLHHLLRNEKGRSLVFTRTKRGADRLMKSLNHAGLEAAVIHGDRSQSQRISALTGFQKGKYRVLVATDVAARGIHVEDIAHVINYDLPEITENFIHRVGRTGRAGRSGLASTIITSDQRTELFKLERSLGVRIEKFRPDADSNLRYATEMNTATHTTLRPERGPATRRSSQLPGEFFQTRAAV